NAQVESRICREPYWCRSPAPAGLVSAGARSCCRAAEVGRQSAAEKKSRAVEPGFDRRDGGAEQVGNLPVRQPFEIAQHNDAFVQRPYLIQRRAEQTVNLTH